jgi:hypothetical protein
MDMKNIVSKVQFGFDWLQDALESIENRWVVFLVACFLIILFQAAGAKGLALLIALFYIMYFVTMKL